MERKSSEGEGENKDKYNSALNLLFYEGQIAWQMNILFIALNVGIGTIIGNSLLDIDHNKFLLLLFSIFGLLINIGWLGTFRRNNRYYHFRMAQARNAEPEEWELLKDGYNFSKGHEIIIDNEDLESKDKKHQLTSFERNASNKSTIGLSIWLFISGFLILAITSCYYIIKC